MALLDLLTRPPRLPRAVDRPRLRHLLLDGIEPGQLLVAPPGSGKTVAAAQLLDAARSAAGSDRRRTGWCRLTPGAAGGDDLVRLIGAALGTPVDDPGAGPLERAATVLELLGDEPVVLVIDDYELARHEECDAVLAEVLGLAPPGCRLLVCSALRPAGLVGRASVGQLAVVGPGELAFTEDEVARLLALLGHDQALAPAVHRDSAGWATAVAVLAEGAGRPDRDLSDALEAILDRAGLVLDGPTSAAVAATAPTADGSATANRVASPAADAPAADGVPAAGDAAVVDGPPVGPGGPTEVDGVDGGVEAAGGLGRSGVGSGGRGEVVEVLAALAVVPALGMGEAEAAGLDAAVLGALGEASALLRPVGDGWALLDVMREPVRRRLGAERLAAAAVRIAPALAARDPLAAAGMLLDVGDDGAAADVLARHASGVGPEAVVPLLYRMRPEVRRRLPPVLSGARATVEMDTALADAEQRVRAAVDRRESAEAQIAVGTILLHRGQLASAGAALEGALRTLGPVDRTGGLPTEVSGSPLLGQVTGGRNRAAEVAVVAVATGWLGLARLWAGDLDGAAAALVPVEHAEPAHAVWSLARWAAAELALARHAVTESTPVASTPGAPGQGQEALERVGQLVGQLRAGGWTVAADAVAARLALAHGAEAAAASQAAAAYRGAAAVGGLDLLVAGPPHAWCLARAGRWSEAAAVADELRRRLGAVDTCARLHADLIAEAEARATGDVMAHARRARDVAAARRLGFAPVEAVAGRWLPAPPAEAEAGVGLRGGVGVGEQAAADGDRGLVVQLLGPVVVTVDGQRIDDRTWRSRKAREVLVVLSLAGEAGRSRDEVIEAVWPDRDPAKGRSLLRTALADVRRALEPERPPGEPSRFLTGHGDRLTLAVRTDLAAAERHRATGDPAGLRAAWHLFRGELAADDPYADSLAEARPSADRLRREIAQALIAGPRSVDPATLVEAAAFLLEREPWRTDVVGPVAAACRAAGDELAATRAERLLGPPEAPK